MDSVDEHQTNEPCMSPVPLENENSTWTLDDMSPKMHQVHQRIALASMMRGGAPLIKRARSHIKPIDFFGVHRTICVTLLRLADSGQEVDIDTFESTFKAVDDQSDISEFLAVCGRMISSERRFPDFVEYRTLLDYLGQIEASPTALYFWYDAGGVLIYVGITNDVSVRQAAHAVRSSWAEFADHSKVQRFLSRAGAEKAEVKAIQSLKPIFNRVHNDTPEAKARLRAYLLKQGRADLLLSGIQRG
ncbi:hypothetical protein [Micromonospora carbonacea]|uniref:GIY-YIG nuclease family protein n=1 Tax=Micromonospora carbonacea TaxID=47853 RepID=A0A1C5ABB7_9ACTN|nr:hypothetical protein [Micromonospora carbonacea]SCF42406.1 hypothetical protein GA0070563_11275 [Micromonospora carbonacea]